MLLPPGDHPAASFGGRRACMAPNDLAASSTKACSREAKRILIRRGPDRSSSDSVSVLLLVFARNRHGCSSFGDSVFARLC